jgi:hypothetical protein
MHFKNTDMTRWGVGEGRLPSTSVDMNFWDLLQRMIAVESDPPEAISISSVTANSTSFTVHFTDGSTDGPFLLPFPKFTVLGPWQPLTLYSQPGSFVTFGGKTYLIEYPHTSAASFDPGANDGSHDFYGLVPFPDTPIIEWIGTYPAGNAVGAYKLFSVPDVGVFLTLLAQAHTAATFDPLGEDGGGNPLYQQVFGSIQTNTARIQFQYAGTPPSDGSTILVYIQDDPRELSFPADWAGSAAHLEVACTATLAWTIVYAGTTIGTITFSPGDLLDGSGGQFGTFSGSGTTAPIQNFELLRLKAPLVSDATARFLSVSLIGSYEDVS